jgi:hypothetical protein
MLNSNSKAQSALVSAFQFNPKGDSRSQGNGKVTDATSDSKAQSALVSASQCIPKGDSRSQDSGKVTDATSDDKDKLFDDHCNRS